MGQGEIDNKYKSLAKLFEDWLRAEIETIGLQGRLREACLSSLLSKGKRVRPVVCLAVGEMLEIDLNHLRPFTLALELIHTSSLIHDDLPALDNDDLRRGEPTCHKQFGEGVALLAGDVLLIRAFGLLAQAPEVSAETRAAWGGLLSDCSVELCNGQTLDLALLGKGEGQAPSTDAKLLESLCFMKTAALFRAAMLAPVICLPVERRSAALSTFADVGNQLGLLFQLTDDLLDYADEPSAMNYAHQLGVQATEARADLALNLALKNLEPFGVRAEFLRELLRSVRTRKA